MNLPARGGRRGSILGAPFAILVPPPPPLEELTRLALTTRPDLVAARRGIGRAESEVKLARANRFDDVFLFYDPFSYQDNRITQPAQRPVLGARPDGPPADLQPQPGEHRPGRQQPDPDPDRAGRPGASGRLRSPPGRSRVPDSRQALERAERTILPRARRDRAKADAEFAAGTIGLGDYLDRLDDDNDAAKPYRDALVRHRRACSTSTRPSDSGSCPESRKEMEAGSHPLYRIQLPAFDTRQQARRQGIAEGLALLRGFEFVELPDGP